LNMHYKAAHTAYTQPKRCDAFVILRIQQFDIQQIVRACGYATQNFNKKTSEQLGPGSRNTVEIG